MLSTSGLTKATPVCFQGILLVNFCLAMLDKAFALGMWMWKGLVSKIAHGSFTQTHLISIILKPKTYPCTCVLRPLEGCDNGIHSPRIALICAIELLLLALLLLKVPPGSLQFTRQTFVLS